MTDAAFIPIGGTSGQPGYDISMDGGDLLTEKGLKTAVVISLFTDRIAAADDILPDGGNDRRGHWADHYGEAAGRPEGDSIGSRLWLLAREKQTTETLNRAVEYAREALDWLVQDDVAASIAVSGQWLRSGTLGMIINIRRPDASTDIFRFEKSWEATLNAV